MKILITAHGSPYTKRMLAYIAAHDERLGSRHQYTVIHCVLAVLHRAAAFVGRGRVRKYSDEAAESVLGPTCAFFAMQGIDVTFVYRIGAPAESNSKLAEQGRFDLLIMG